MKRKIVWLVVVLFFIVSLFLFSQLLKEKRKINQSELKNQVCFQDNCFEVEIARTFSEQKMGLMFRKNLAIDEGMLFVFNEEKEHSFWMKDTFIPLDIIWLNEKKEIVFISKNNQPCLSEPCPIIKPTKKARYVLEINSGLADKIGLKEGDKAFFQRK